MKQDYIAASKLVEYVKILEEDLVNDDPFTDPETYFHTNKGVTGAFKDLLSSLHTVLQSNGKQRILRVCITTFTSN